jgi:16S rRNA (adenine1518-N6/adenine1519-N6)-dimethyltransferase
VAATVRTRRQRLGQHFLADPNVAEAIVAILPPQPPRVLEIGPGHGALTMLLAERFPRLVVVELDGALAAGLRRRVGGRAGIEVISADALEMPLDRLATEQPWQVVGNLPYSVATPIVRRLLPYHELATQLVVMVQREVAGRLAAPPGSGARGLLTVERELHADCEVLFTVAPRSFRPPPRVVSAVIRLALRPTPVSAALSSRALELAGAGFTQRRKKLTNALGRLAAPSSIAAALAEIGAEPGARAQDLDLDAWCALAGRLPPGGRE